MSTLEEAEAYRWCIDNGHIKDPFLWTEWERLVTFRPRRSITGKLIVGMNVYARQRRVQAPVDFSPHYEYQFGTKKEVFKQMLMEDNNV